ncbi:putative transcription factor interactor and regulator CCHC(Zn) family [Helianthus annuus]|nr:putative transcription factor interactor and regulator CCHC(Zn) family [Helianthus annuus]
MPLARLPVSITKCPICYLSEHFSAECYIPPIVLKPPNEGSVTRRPTSTLFVHPLLYNVVAPCIFCLFLVQRE